MRKKCASEVLVRIEEQEGERFGIIAADEIIDIVTQNLAPDIYNSALEDVNKLLKKRLEDIEVDIDLLQQRD